MDYNLKGIDRYGLRHKKNERYYVDEARWMSYYYQMRLILEDVDAETLLEIGPGNNFLKNLLRNTVTKHDTFDVDEQSNPTYQNLDQLEKLQNGYYDISCAFQVLEHMPYEDAINMIYLLSKITRKSIIISLPVSIPTWRIFLSLPKLPRKQLIINNFLVKRKNPRFDGTHHWELENKGIKISDFESHLSKFGTVKSFRNFYNPYHHFFSCTLK